MFRLQNNVPEYYVNESRDFQLFCRLFDTTFSGALFNAENVVSSTNAKECNQLILPILAYKVGFFDYESIPNDALRLIISAFPYIIRNKGSEKAIQDCINLYLRYKHESSIDTKIEFTSDHVTITMEKSFSDIYILETLLSYVLPAGCYVTFDTSNIEYLDTILHPESILNTASVSIKQLDKVNNPSSHIYDYLAVSSVGSAVVASNNATSYNETLVTAGDCGNKPFSLQTVTGLNTLYDDNTIKVEAKIDKCRISTDGTNTYLPVGVKDIEFLLSFDDAGEIETKLLNPVVSVYNNSFIITFNKDSYTDWSLNIKVTYYAVDSNTGSYYYKETMIDEENIVTDEPYII